ncbi:class II aldolase/adducin family protein [Vallitalea guaymasensis]|uniref:class II aldolase/adducin family protein n=1 Tax=Vallitalea guaymasensis TaxID=1185412 RepID=UPI002353751C|nr:class II aldolase/adducin family protein [Vallitalea guaymasensis]
MDVTAIKEILEVCERLDKKGMVNAYEGNISIKRDGFIYVTPTGKNKAFLKEEMIAVYEEKTMKQVAGIYPASSEFPLHLCAYKERPDIESVIHCHAPYLTAYSLCNKPIESRAYPEMIGNFKKIEVAEYGTPGGKDIFKGVKPLIAKKDIVIMANHGMIAVGKTVYDAMNKSEAAEAIAKVLYLAENIGEIVDLPDDEVQMFLNK